MKRSTEVLLVVGIVFIALFFRFYHLARIPAGLSPVEAYVGNQATVVIQGLGTFAETRAPLFVQLQSSAIARFGNVPWALRLWPAVVGTLTVLGLYLLARTLFNWQIAALASFLLAISSWHITFSRAGFGEIMVPLFTTWGLYIFWQALARVEVSRFIAAGVIWGVGLYFYPWFWLFLTIPLLTILAYIHMIRKDFGHKKYTEIRNTILRGIAGMALALFLLWLPLGFQLYINPDETLTQLTNYIPINSSDHVGQFLINSWAVIGMFLTRGDTDWLHGVGNKPLLWWPLAALAVVGFVKSFIKLVKHKQTHGHFSPIHVLLLSWFFIGTLPSALTIGYAPDALRALGAAPVVMIFAAEGLWWLLQFFHRWYKARDLHGATVSLPGIGSHYYHEAKLVSGVLLVAFLAALATQSFGSYFGTWVADYRTAKAYAYSVTARAQALARRSPAQPTYIVTPSDEAIDGLPANMQTFMFLTDTTTPEKQKARNLLLLTPLQYEQRQFPRNAPVIIVK